MSAAARATRPYSPTKTGARPISRSGTSGPFGTSGTSGTAKTLTSNGRVPQGDDRPGPPSTVIRQQETSLYTIRPVSGP
ncbi:hypothetical protein ACIBO6_04870 [Streptomyces luteogriseus]|uniref:hypothetical protein n=1 Tax=Streptomyces luteogriseus TaxID=68233 RepID=UPI00379D70BA